MSPRRSNGRRVVPLKVARELVEERDRAIEELQKARRRIDELESGDRSGDEEREQLQRRARRAEEQVEELREKLDEVEERFDVEAGEPDEETEEDDEKEKLKRRAERLSEDLERIRGRTAETVEAARRDERIRLLSGLGEVVDSVDRALEMGDPSGPWRKGLEAIRTRFLEFLQREGVELVGEVGEEMDPNVHQAVSTIEAPEYDSGTVVRVDRPGIVLEDGTVVRPAQVVVSR